MWSGIAMHRFGVEGLGFRGLGFEVGGKVKGVGPCLGMITVARAASSFWPRD